MALELDFFNLLEITGGLCALWGFLLLNVKQTQS